jgi:hypothetical protein
VAAGEGDGPGKENETPFLKWNGVFLFFLGMDDFPEIRVGKTIRKNGKNQGGKKEKISIFEPFKKLT